MSKLLVILGPTASGKSALGMKLAQKYEGEIICADSRTIYREMDIATAKPTQADMLLIPHHLVDIKMPNEQFSASEFKSLATEKNESISGKGHLPIMVGGTGLYIDSVLYDYQFPQEASSHEREALSKMSLEQLLEELKRVDPEALESIDTKNPRRVMRAIETAGQPANKNNEMRPDTLVLGMALNKEVIQARIEKRLQIMLKNGLLDEVKKLGEKYGWDSEAMTGIGYRAFKDVVLGTKSIEESIAEDVKQEMALVKRQMTWFKRNPEIHWLDAEDPEKLFVEADKLVSEFARA